MTWTLPAEHEANVISYRRANFFCVPIILHTNDVNSWIQLKYHLVEKSGNFVKELCHLIFHSARLFHWHWINRMLKIQPVQVHVTNSHQSTITDNSVQCLIYAASCLWNTHVRQYRSSGKISMLLFNSDLCSFSSLFITLGSSLLCYFWPHCNRRRLCNLDNKA